MTTHSTILRSAKVHNALRALADAVAEELEISPQVIENFSDELMIEIAEIIQGTANALTPEDTLTYTDADLAVPPGDFGATPTHNDDTNAHGFYDCHETDAGGL